MKKFIPILLMFLGATMAVFVQDSKKEVYVDEKGVIRWPDGKEVHGFGVNYTVPFAHAFRSAKKLGVDPKKAIDDDVYHFARLGFDAYRVHVWDTEISDTSGNLLVNEHLEFFDYMLNEMKKRGMKFILTPIAFWGNGWPDRNEDTPGFSHKYGKDACLTNLDAINAQENYLYQFLNHVSPYTAKAYKDDPDIVAFEISNEPHHREESGQVTKYIQRMVDAMRKTGCEKPIFYNVSHSVHLVEAYFDADIQGGTFQWYPTGLGFQKELKGNMLPNVDDYHIPFDSIIQNHGGAKIVYEFDAADIGQSYIYPAIARSFRAAGIQWATHFSYDPTFMAYANTEYNTHFMNLLYAPQKALSLKIAAEVFHQVPMAKDYGNYPSNTRFDAFRVSYAEDVAEMVTENQFIYTNTTNTFPPAPNKLNEVAGFGYSPIVKYDGLGAYFLDQIEKGVWRLEVMPDAIWVDNLFGWNSLDKIRAVIHWKEWPMTINLPDLGSDFEIHPLNEGNAFQAEVDESDFVIAPGTYLILKKGKKPNYTGEEKFGNIRLNEFVAPLSTVDKTYVVHKPPREINQGLEFKISATVVTPNDPNSVRAKLAGFGGKSFEMTREAGYTFSAVIPADEVSEGYLQYNIIVDDGKNSLFFPGGIAQNSIEGLIPKESYEISVLTDTQPVYLFDAFANHRFINTPWSQGLGIKPLASPNKALFEINPPRLFRKDPENPGAEKVHDHSIRIYFADEIAGRSTSVIKKNRLIIRGKSMNKKECLIQVGLINKSGDAYSALVTLQPELSEHTLTLDALQPVKLITLPRPYPSFLPYFFQGGAGKPFDISEMEALQISIGPGIQADKLEERHGIAIESIRLE